MISTSLTQMDSGTPHGRYQHDYPPYRPSHSHRWTQAYYSIWSMGTKICRQELEASFQLLNFTDWYYSVKVKGSIMRHRGRSKQKNVKNTKIRRTTTFSLVDCCTHSQLIEQLHQVVVLQLGLHHVNCATLR